MLSSGGQVAFLVCLAKVEKYSQSLENIKIDAKVGEERAKMVAYEKAIFRMHEPFEKMMNNDSWHRALMKLQSLFDDIHEESVQGLTLSKRSEASMELLRDLEDGKNLNRWLFLYWRCVRGRENALLVCFYFLRPCHKETSKKRRHG